MASEKKTEESAKGVEYVIPLRREWRKVANYRRAGRAIKAIKKFVARHAKVPERDLEKVKIDSSLNEEIWFRGRRHPPAKIKVRVERDGDVWRVYLAEEPAEIKFRKEKLARRHAPREKKEEKEEKKEKEEKGESAEEKKEEKEKEAAVAEVREAEARESAKAAKHAKLPKKTLVPRKVLKK
ncbi:50S ribosomal protein L31e [Candidatus Pacearchaeota archaeon]|nr:MAG: 50S ribosomal protein L31e [Candidatus Pacearchaeota archaeon]